MKLCNVLVALLFLAGSVHEADATERVLQPGADLPIAVQEASDGDVILLTPGRYRGAAVLDGKHVIIVGAAEGETIVDPGLSNVVFGSLNGARLELRGVSIETSAEAPFAIYVQGGSASCDRCVIRASTKGPLYSEAGNLTLFNSRVVASTGEAIVALSGSTVRLEQTEIQSETGSPLIAQELKGLLIHGSQLSGSNGVSVTGPQADVVVEQTQITSRNADTHGLDLRVGGRVEVSNSKLLGGRFGLATVLEPGSSLMLKRTSATGSVGGLYFEQQTAGAAALITVEESLAIATGTDDQSIALRGLGPLVLNVLNTDLLSGGIVAAGAGGQDARLVIKGGTLLGSRSGAAALGDVSPKIELHDVLVIAPTVAEIPEAVIDSPTRKLFQSLENNVGLKQEFGAAAIAARTGDATLIRSLAERARSAAAAAATVELKVTDAVGRTITPAFTVLDLNGTMVAESPDKLPVIVPAGTYIVEAKFDASLSMDIEIVAGQAAIANVQATDALLLDLNVSKDGVDRWILFRTLPEQQVRAVWRAVEPSHAYSARLSLRKTASKEDIDAALDAARRLIATTLTFPKEGTNDAKVEYWTWQSAVFDWALPALAVTGVAADVPLMLQGLERSESFYDRYRLLGFPAYLEHRLGILASGEIAAIASGSDKAVAAHALRLMHYYGVPGTSQKLIALMKDEEGFDALPTLLRDEIAAVGAGLEGTEFSTIASRLLSRAVEKVRKEPTNEARLFNYSTFPAAVYLLVFGTVEEKKIITDELLRSKPSRWDLQIHLARIAADPTPFFDELPKDKFSSDSQANVLCSAYRLRGEKQFNHLMDAMIAAFARYAVATKDYVEASQQAYHTADITRRLLLGGCRPDEFVGNAYYADLVQPSKHGVPGNWYPGFHMVEPMLEFMAQKSGSGPVESSPVDVVMSAWERITTPPWTTYKKERMALFKAFTKSGDTIYNNLVNDGIERRVYVLRHVVPDKYSGAIHGHLEVRPQAENGKLTVGIRLNQVPYYSGYGELGTHIETQGGNLSYWIHQPYVVDGGRKLLENVVLKRGSESIVLRESGMDSDGYYRLTSDVDADDLSSLVLLVDLALFGDRRSFWFDLYAGGYARQRSR